MKKALLTSCILVATQLFSFAQQTQRVVAECTVSYSITTNETADKETQEALKNTKKTVFIKANQSRVDFQSPSFSQSILYDKTNGNAVVLREIGNGKYMSKLDSNQWKEENKKTDGAKVVLIPTESKTILGYDCKKATLTLKDGTVYTLFYASNIVPSVKEFEYYFKDIPGFVLEYESQDANGKKVTYTASKINLSPVLSSKFDVPTSGYRIL